MCRVVMKFPLSEVAQNVRAEAPGPSPGQQRALEPGNGSVLRAGRQTPPNWLPWVRNRIAFFLLNVNENHLGKGCFCPDWCFVGTVFYKLSVAPNTVVQWKNLELEEKKCSPFSLRCDFTKRNYTFVVTLYHLKLNIMVDIKSMLEKLFFPNVKLLMSF